MARKNRDFSDVFNSLNVERNEDDNETNENMNVDDVDSDTDQTSTQNDVTLNPSSSDNETNNFTDFKTSILTKYEEKRKKKTVEETHIRTTFLLRKDLAKRLNKITRNKHGLKTILLNNAVEAIVKAMEEEN